MAVPQTVILAPSLQSDWTNGEAELNFREFSISCLECDVCQPLLVPLVSPYFLLSARLTESVASHDAGDFVVLALLCALAIVQTEKEKEKEKEKEV